MECSPRAHTHMPTSARHTQPIYASIASSSDASTRRHREVPRMPATAMQQHAARKNLADVLPRGATYEEMCLTAQSRLQMVALTHANEP